jgi:RNA-directed DNA polymerase
LDVVWQQHGRRLGVLVRYAVDFIIVCPTVTARDLAARTLATVGLSFNPDKTRVVDLRMGKHGFAFLGFHFRKVESHRWRGRWYCQRWPSTNAMASVPAKIRAETTRAFVGHSLDDRVEVLNPILRGWGNYFAVGNSARAFKTIDRYVFERLALFTSKKHSRRGRRWQAQHNWSWYSRLDIHQLSGRVAWNAPHASR